MAMPNARKAVRGLSISCGTGSGRTACAASRRSPVTFPSAPKCCRRSPPKRLQAWPEPEQKSRPLLLLPRAEPTEVMALIPDGPPRRFRWRGVTYEVTAPKGRNASPANGGIWNLARSFPRQRESGS